MYKIYINNIKLILANTEDSKLIATENPVLTLVEYTGKQKQMKEVIDELERLDGIEDYCMYFHNFEELKKDFKSNYRTVKASGGLVKNQYDEYLFIFRRGMWDLPKGKMEKNETKEKTGVREVEEETGIKKVFIEKKLGKTYHTYKNRIGTRIIKKSYWYLMSTTKQPLIPETSEDILEAKWITLKDFYQLDKPCFRNIFDVVDTYAKGLESNNP